MEFRKILATVVGAVQVVIGTLAVIFVFIIYHNFFNVQNLLSISGKNVILYALLLFLFGSVSIISGLFLIKERL